MRRFFVDESLALGPYLLTGDDVHHIRDVLRLSAGDSIILADSSGTDFTGVIAGFAPDGLKVTLLERSPNRTEPIYRATLFQGLAKGDKMDAIIQKAVELGVARIVPVQCRRSVVRLAAADAARKTARWQKIAAEAAKQSGRGQIPQVAEPVDFAAAALEASQAAVSLMPWEGERQCSVRDFLESTPMRTAGPLTISLLIGPEGGFSADEVDLAARSGIRTVTIGRRILRTETAGAAVLAMLIYRYDEF
jgi:16S rRNA (uracil1498-N3)-methyltransferase